MFKLKTTHKIQIAVFLLVAVALIIVFSILVDDNSWFSGPQETFYVSYGFGGGIQRGAPVRIAGIDSGRVTNVSLIRDPIHPVRVTIRLPKSKAFWLKEDALCFINTAGVMGETYMEIKPGPMTSPPLKPGSTLIGKDPPRMDAILAEGYMVFRQVNQVLATIHPQIQLFAKTFEPFLQHINQGFQDLTTVQKKFLVRKAFRLIGHLETLTRRLAQDRETWNRLSNVIQRIDILSQHLTSQKASEITATVDRLLKKVDDLDEQTIRQFLQEEGIRARIF